MLAAPHRLTRPADFTAVVRRGARAGRSTLVVHLLLPDGEAGADPHPAHVPAPMPARVGFVVPKAVGNSVVRHRVTRRLRALCAERLPAWPDGARIVVRALPPAATAAYAVLGTDLDQGVRRAQARARSIGVAQ